MGPNTKIPYSDPAPDFLAVTQQHQTATQHQTVEELQRHVLKIKELVPLDYCAVLQKATQPTAPQKIHAYNITP